jgi:hypothetical protein
MAATQQLAQANAGLPLRDGCCRNRKADTGEFEAEPAS